MIEAAPVGPEAARWDARRLMKAIGASKKKSDKLDARKIDDLARCDLLPACYVAPPAA